MSRRQFCNIVHARSAKIYAAVITRGKKIGRDNAKFIGPWAGEVSILEAWLMKGRGRGWGW